MPCMHFLCVNNTGLQQEYDIGIDALCFTAWTITLYRVGIYKIEPYLFHICPLSWRRKSLRTVQDIGYTTASTNVYAGTKTLVEMRETVNSNSRLTHFVTRTIMAAFGSKMMATPTSLRIYYDASAQTSKTTNNSFCTMFEVFHPYAL